MFMFIDLQISLKILRKQALHLEVGKLGIILQRIQDAIATMNQEVRDLNYDIQYYGLYINSWCKLFLV